MIASVLVGTSAAIVLVLGLAHLYFTFVGPRLRPRDAALQARMGEVHPGITRQTTMWKAWIGFNASHSLGAILFGLVYGYLALVHASVLFGSWFLLAVGLGMLLGLVVLAQRYWFRVPLAGAGVATALFLSGIVASRA